jgi:hypothetical protein
MHIGHRCRAEGFEVVGPLRCLAAGGIVDHTPEDLVVRDGTCNPVPIPIAGLSTQ